MSTKLNPNNPAPTWDSVPWVIRASNCVLFLSAHKFISESEAKRAYELIEQWESEWNEKAKA